MESKNKLRNSSPEEQVRVLFSGVDMETGLEKNMQGELLKKLKENRPLVVKAGFDPSSPDLHLGHSILINKLRQFQELGHKVTFVVGDFTACIGDPSGQNKTRPVMSFEEVKKNAESYKAQATGGPIRVKRELDEESRQILSFFQRLDLEKTKWPYNSEWLSDIPLRDFIMELSSTFTVARQLEREDFSQRYKDKKPIGLHEFLYPILQAYDSMEIKADVEIGGTDQLFNLLLGRELQEKKGQSPQVVLTLSLLEGIDSKQLPKKNSRIKTAPHYDDRQPEENWNIKGARKMSKSLNNAIAFNDSPKEIYGKTMKISDDLLDRYWHLFTEGRTHLKPLFQSGEQHPKKQKEKLAWLLVCAFHGEDKANVAQQEFNRVFSQKGLPDQIREEQDIDKFFPDIKSVEQIPKEGKKIAVYQLVKKAGLSPSASEARRGVESGAVKKGFEAKGKTDVEWEKIQNPQEEIYLNPGEEFLLSFGKRKIKRISFKWKKTHDLKAFLVYKKIKKGGDKNRLCEELSEDEDFKNYISLSSIKMKIENYRYLDTDGKEGRAHYSKQSKKIFERDKDW